MPQPTGNSSPSTRSAADCELSRAGHPRPRTNPATLCPRGQVRAAGARGFTLRRLAPSPAASVPRPRDISRRTCGARGGCVIGESRPERFSRAPRTRRSIFNRAPLSEAPAAHARRRARGRRRRPATRRPTGTRARAGRPPFRGAAPARRSGTVRSFAIFNAPPLSIPGILGGRGGGR